jgi:hypothetical protein
MLSAIALLFPLCLARKEPHSSSTIRTRLRYYCDIVLIAVAFALTLTGMPLWHQMLGASLLDKGDIWPGLRLLGWNGNTSIALVYYLVSAGLAELKRMTS